ncbi:COX5A-domain-containing protein [Metschnikowia bicuspidata]|uniref:Cytochrome c oxidase subunit 6, mitochondrial n=1 Tax=Metschnikowia bicuspidata TaxID=27322 RepID=A0A4P9ZKR2_9ASCO|nr:COX5A-domain-containing protein [Metschnikowia bicuspidata]
MFSSSLRSFLRSRALVVPRLTAPSVRVVIPQIRMYSAHHEETFEEFTARYESEFEDAYDLFEVQRVLNNCFSYDLVPAPSVIEKALEACRRVNDYPTAVRTFEALKYKVETPQQYQAYLDELKEVRGKFGIDLKEELYSS